MTMKIKKTNVNSGEGLLVVEVCNSNPNGDPDDEGAPRVNRFTHRGEVTDVHTKRLIRNMIVNLNFGEILVKRGAVLNKKVNEAYAKAGVTEKNMKVEDGNLELVRECKDVKWFGAVTTKPWNSSITGPVTIGFGQSAYPVTVINHGITRCAASSEERVESRKSKSTNEIGRKSVVVHGVYLIPWQVDGFRSDTVEFTKQDLAELTDCILHMYRHNHSSARPQITLRFAAYFEHDSALRSYESMELLEMIKVSSEKGADSTCWADYTVTVPDEIPKGVKLHILKNGLSESNPFR